MRGFLTADLFDSIADEGAMREVIAQGAVLFRGLARPIEHELVAALRDITAQAPFRRMFTPGRYQMSVAMTSCGDCGWVTDRSGYRYDAIDPQSGKRWPAMPPWLRRFAIEAAQDAGFAGFLPDACLINRYEVGARMSLHQDKDERDFGAPIVSISLGLTATFLFGGMKRSDKPRRFRLLHGDVIVWGGPARLAYPWRRPVGRRRTSAARPPAHQLHFP